MATPVSSLTATQATVEELSDVGNETVAAVVDERIRAVDALFNRYRKRLVSYVTGLMSSAEDAEDIVQETYARLLEVPSLDAVESRVRGYTYRIATNLAYDRFRARRARGNRVELKDSELSDSDLDPGHILGIEQCIEVIRQTILDIKPRSRQVYLLRTAEQLSYPEIAERLGVSTRTVEREMRYVIELCQRKLQSGLLP